MHTRITVLVLIYFSYFRKASLRQQTTPSTITRADTPGKVLEQSHTKSAVKNPKRVFLPKISAIPLANVVRNVSTRNSNLKCDPPLSPLA